MTREINRLRLSPYVSPVFIHIYGAHMAVVALLYINMFTVREMCSFAHHKG